MEDDLLNKVAQITNKDTLVVGSDYNLEHSGVQSVWIRHGGRN